jgi:hypothetical protein
MILEGKLELAEITKIKKGMLVYNKGMVCEVIDVTESEIFKLKSVKLQTIKGQIRSYHSLSELRTIVIKYDCQFNGMEYAMLDWTQWQAVLDRNLIDKNIHVNFNLQNNTGTIISNIEPIPEKQVSLDAEELSKIIKHLRYACYFYEDLPFPNKLEGFRHECVDLVFMLEKKLNNI